MCLICERCLKRAQHLGLFCVKLGRQEESSLQQRPLVFAQCNRVYHLKRDVQITLQIMNPQVLPIAADLSA